jgi:hypothetical protein
MRLIAMLGMAVWLAMAAGCAPRAAPLRGTIAPVRLPATELPPIHQKVVFHWTYSDRDVHMSGDGAARIAPPDSVRLDLFLGSGLGSGSAVLIGDDLRTAGDDEIRRYLPPVPLLWASLGRLSVPAAHDTSARTDGDTLRVDIGHEPRWRTTFVGRELRRLELIDGDRIRQWLTRRASEVHYHHTQARRTLDLTITRVDTVPGFDETIWR